ncbi:MAG TPA: DOMON-like domain-containing protein [Sphingomonas sp.]|nr:DOMON-like domain-containing protein [Sphingomonas sp.]
MSIQLTPHPDHPSRGVARVEVTADIRRGSSVLTYRASGEAPLIPPPAAPGRTDGLWQHTCFELFVKPVGGDGYFEFNFSPSTQWAAYQFEGYRAGMRDLQLAVPVIEPVEDGIRVRIDLAGLPEGEWRVAITAVIEAADGSKSYWSAAHGAGKADFHADAGFVIEVPA